MKNFLSQISSAKMSNWIMALTSVAIVVLTLFQFRLSKQQADIQELLVKTQLLPSIDLQYNHSLGTLFIKNTGSVQFFFHVGVVNTYGDTPEFSKENKDEYRIIPINGTFPLAFKVEVNRAVFKDGVPNDFMLPGRFIISTPNNQIFDVKFKVKAGLTFKSPNDDVPIIHYENAWIEEMATINRFPWE